MKESGKSVPVRVSKGACRLSILKSIRERTEKTLTPDAQPNSEADAEQRQQKKMEIDQSTRKDVSKEEVGSK
jgi:hypothetical protein